MNAAGPLYLHSMFRAEGQWGEYKRRLANPKCPEANMTLNAADKEMVRVYSVVHGGGAGTGADDDATGCWGVHNSLKYPYMDGPWFEPKVGESVVMLGGLYANMHLFYLAEDEVYAEAWAEYVKQVMPGYANQRGWGSRECVRRSGANAWDFSVGALEDLQGYWARWVEVNCPGDAVQFAACRKLFNRQMWRHKSMVLNSLKFVEGGWIMARPNAANGDLGEIREPVAGLPQCGVPRRMWFGKIKGFYSHMPSELDPEVVSKIADVEWHPTVDVPHGPYDVDVQAPVVYAGKDKNHPPLFSCLSILPLQMAALQHPNRSRAGQLIMMRPSWHALSAVNCPVPWPKLMLYRKNGG